MKVFKTALFTATAIAVSVSAQCKEYLGFDLGSATDTAVKTQLDNAGAQYETSYGYKGYSDLTMYKVNSFSGFSKYGNVSSAWLYFTPESTLYKVEVTYADAGSTYRIFSDALSGRYTLTNSGGFGFDKTATYRDGDVQINLKRNEFGFGSNQKTTLEYVYQPALSEVDTMKSRIEEAIRRENAQKAGDL